jgi:hypothetical protein
MNRGVKPGWGQAGSGQLVDQRALDQTGINEAAHVNPVNLLAAITYNFRMRFAAPSC